MRSLSPSDELRISVILNEDASPLSDLSPSAFTGISAPANLDTERTTAAAMKDDSAFPNLLPVEFINLPVLILFIHSERF